MISRQLQQFHYICQSFFCDMVKVFHVGISFIFTFPLMLSYDMSLPAELEHFHDLGSLLHYSCYSLSGFCIKARFTIYKKFDP